MTAGLREGAALALAKFTELRDLLEQAAEVLTDLEAMARPRAACSASHVAPDGTATLAHEDLLVVLGALRDARHATDPASAVRYAALARALGDDL